MIALPYCGSELVEVMVECDSGTLKECEKDPFQCAYSVCCKNCQFLPCGAACRGKSKKCDLSEYYNGINQLCHDNVYSYNEVCQHYKEQCQNLFVQNSDENLFESITCSAVDLNLGFDVPNPGMANEGTKCKDRKEWMIYQCSKCLHSSL
uniref:Disintegrin domain-containing protein n=1 Tax=Erpetoichthys calabaricus TaxID=27687 RepID=A0A8C4RDV1_ERPCA